VNIDQSATLSTTLGTQRPRTTPDASLIWKAFELSRDDRPQLFCCEDGGYTSLTWDQWRSAAEEVAAGLRRRGIGPGARLAAVLTNTSDVCAAIIGSWLAGAVVLSFPTMRRGMSAAEYLQQLRRLCESTGAQALLLEDRFLAQFSAHELRTPVHGFASLRASGKREHAPVGNDDVAFVQYSSGSTSEPKGCVLTLGAISAQERMLTSRLQIDGESRGVSWLPLSHDMGLFGCLLLSWTSGMRLMLGSPERFLRQPHTWMDDCVDFAATITVTPNFGLALAARRARVRPPRGPIPMRSVVLGGERIEWRTLTDADDVLGPFGVTMQTLTPAYGLAQATLAVSMKRFGEKPKALAIDGERSYNEDLRLLDTTDARARMAVSCGPSMPNVSLRTTAGSGLGKLCVRSAALACGYLDDLPASAERFTPDGELLTEDLGFIHCEELYVLGRTDDIIPVAGRNLHARDVEVAVEQCAGIRPGCAVLIDGLGDDRSQLALIAETSAGKHDLAALADAAATAAFRAGGARVSECIFITAGTLPKTPSGKIQRLRARGLLGSTSAAILERVAL
jgi:fatty-acyl-CoA synthase